MPLSRNGLALVAILAAVSIVRSGAQGLEPLPIALEQMIATERSFAARALEVGWKRAFLDYFDSFAVGFEHGQVGFATDQIEKTPDPPPDLTVIWEPRYGDVAANGELGYLTGPVRRVQPSVNKGQARHSTYFSIWKRQRDGTFKVVLDLGVDTPGPVRFPAGFTRAPHDNRFNGDYDDTTPPLAAADGVLNSGLRSSPAQAYRGRLADGARFYRPGRLPVVGERAIGRWLSSQPGLSASDTRWAEAARSGDLGYTWGTYIRRAPLAAPGREGFYARVWVRERNGQWNVALDIIQPQ